jgi:hypothetical protein
MKGDKKNRLGDLVTNVPSPGRASNNPIADRARSASLTEDLPTPSLSASSRSDGSFSPGDNSLLMINSRNWLKISSANVVRDTGFSLSSSFTVITYSFMVIRLQIILYANVERPGPIALVFFRGSNKDLQRIIEERSIMPKLKDIPCTHR